MTNLQTPSPNSRFPITPEQALVLLPALGGVLAAAVMAAAALLPLLTQVSQQDERLRLYQKQEQDLPLLRRQQLTLQVKIDQATAQEQRLLKLVSDVEELDTLLTALNQMAGASGVAMVSVEPERELSSADGKPARPKPKAQDQAKKSALPEDDRFEKRSFLMTVDGPYVGLLEFLRKVETLNTAVLISDLEIQASGSPGSGGGATGGDASGQNKPSMKFRLTAYKRIPPESGKEDAESSSSP
jgi:type IV pilus assembly protein PilO